MEESDDDEMMVEATRNLNRLVDEYSIRDAEMAEAMRSPKRLLNEFAVLTSTLPTAALSLSILSISLFLARVMDFIFLFLGA